VSVRQFIHVKVVGVEDEIVFEDFDEVIVDDSNLLYLSKANENDAYGPGESGAAFAPGQWMYYRFVDHQEVVV